MRGQQLPAQHSGRAPRWRASVLLGCAVLLLSLASFIPVSATSLTGKVYPGPDGDPPDQSDDSIDCAIAVSLTSMHGYATAGANGAPTIARITEPLLALPGDEVSFTITVANKGKKPISNLVITDHVPPSFMVQSAYPERDQTIVGNLVIFYVDDMPPGKTRTLTINTRIKSDTAISSRINNEAWLIADGITRRISSTAVHVAGRVTAATGSEDDVKDALFDDLGWLWLAIIPGLLVGLTVVRGWQRRHAR